MQIWTIERIRSGSFFIRKVQNGQLDATKCSWFVHDVRSFPAFRVGEEERERGGVQPGGLPTRTLGSTVPRALHGGGGESRDLPLVSSLGQDPAEVGSLLPLGRSEGCRKVARLEVRGRPDHWTTRTQDVLPRLCQQPRPRAPDPAGLNSLPYNNTTPPPSCRCLALSWRGGVFAF